MIPATALAYLQALEDAAPTCATCEHRQPYKRGRRGKCAILPMITYDDFDKCKAHAMAKLPTKTKGTPIGSTHKLDPKTGILEPIKKKLSPPAEYARKKRRKYSRVAK